MKIIKNFLIGGIASAAEGVPIIGPLVIVPAKISIQALSSIAQLTIALLTATTLLITVSCFLFKASIRILSSTTSGLYHLFAATKKSY